MLVWPTCSLFSDCVHTRAVEKPKMVFGHGHGSNPGSRSAKGIPIAGMLSLHGTDLLISRVSDHLQVKHFREDD